MLSDDEKKLRVHDYNAWYYAAHKDAERERHAAWRREHPEERRAQKKRWREANAAKVKAQKHASYLRHRDKALAKQAAYNAAHPGQASARAAQWNKDHPAQRAAQHAKRKAAKRGALVNDFTAAQWRTMQAHYNHCCVYCGKRAKGHLTQDHITPLAHGGSHTLHNIVPACRTCNSRKGTRVVPVAVQPLLV